MKRRIFEKRKMCGQGRGYLSRRIGLNIRQLFR
jgi:hypothetical protein